MTPRAVLVGGCPGDTRRYRVDHAAEALELAGWHVATHAVEDPASMPPPADLAGTRALILHRVAWSAPIAALVDAARAAGAAVLFDADDLVFEAAYEARRKALRAAQAAHAAAESEPWPADPGDPARRGALGAGLDAPPARYARTLAACDGALAATGSLAAALEARGTRAAVVRNALDLGLLRLSTEAMARRAPRRPGDRVVLGYASGTPTHDRDLAVAAPALRALLEARPDVVLRLIGPVALPDGWEDLADRVERVPLLPWPLLPAALAELDVNLAPLEVGDPFCEAKSELKLVEAGAVGVPTVASPTDAFVHAMRDGSNGLLAHGDAAWLGALTRLVDDPALRAALGAAARATVVERYATDVRGPELVDAIARLRGGAGAPSPSDRPDGGGRHADRPAALGGAAAHPPVVEDVPGLDRFAMGADYVAAEDTVLRGGTILARGPWLAAHLAARRGADQRVRAVPYPIDPATHWPGDPARERPMRVLLDVAPEPPVDPSTRALGLDAVVLAAAAVPGLRVDLYASRPGGKPPREPRLDRFGWLGVLDDAALADHLRRAAALVSPACGNAPLAALQAMACGCAVVGCDVPAVRWLLVDGTTAALAPPQADALAAAIARAAQDAALRERLALGALAAVERQTAGRARAVLAAPDDDEGSGAERWLDRLQPLGGAAGPPLAPGVAAGQSFVARRDGLCRIDVQLAAPLPAGAELRLALASRDGEVARRTAVAAGPRRAEAWLALAFAPIPDSGGRRFLAELSVHGGEPGAPPAALCMADAAVLAAGRTYLGGRADDGAALALRTWCRADAPAPDLALADPRQAALDVLRHLALAAGDVAEGEDHRAAAWLDRWSAPLPPVDRRPWAPDAPATVKLWGTLRHYGPLAVAREALALLRWRRMSPGEREAALRGN